MSWKVDQPDTGGGALRCHGLDENGDDISAGNQMWFPAPATTPPPTLDETFLEQLTAS